MLVQEHHVIEGYRWFASVERQEQADHSHSLVVWVFGWRVERVVLLGNWMVLALPQDAIHQARTPRADKSAMGAINRPLRVFRPVEGLG